MSQRPSELRARNKVKMTMLCEVKRATIKWDRFFISFEVYFNRDVTCEIVSFGHHK